MNILDKIVAIKREEVKARKKSNPVATLERSEYFKRDMPSFHEALAKREPSVICEFKRKSPSKGEIKPSADILNIVPGYQQAGAAALSILTDEKFFGGKNSDLRDAAGLVRIPLLRKDFIVDEYQVLEAKSIGASAILLIASILSKDEVDKLSDMAIKLGMDVLFEIHDISDLKKMSQKIRIIGVNNRNLKTLEVSLDNSADLLKHLPTDCLSVAESGFVDCEDVMMLFYMGYDAFLIGENFMKTPDPGSTAAHFIKNLKSATA